METIIYTDNKRLSTDYSVDKTLFAQKIDINHILNTEVYQSHISKVKFWIIRPNIASEQNFILQVCKNLVNKGTNSINFQFNITKICTGQQTIVTEQKRINSVADKFMRSSRVSAYLKPSMLKTLQFPLFLSNNKKQSFHSKSNSSGQWNIQNQSNNQIKKPIQTIPTSKPQQITLKQLGKKQFQISTVNELSAIFVNRQKIYLDFNLVEETFQKTKRIISNYVFRQNDVQIEICVVSEGCRKYIEKVINIQISEAFNVQFNNRKQAYETQSFSSSPKSSTKLNQQNSKQTYHKILLFLFTHYDLQTQKSKTSNVISLMSVKESNKFIQAIQQWKIKDEDINFTEKLSKEYVLIKQEIQNQKNNFKNRLKIFEAIIGQSVNVDKLLNQEKQMQSSSNMNPPNQTSSNALNDIRVSRRSQMKAVLIPPTSIIPASSNNSQFKRLKQSYQMIRNIDNIINEQTKKIESLKKYLKQTVKQKNQTLYKHARSLNQVKKQIKQVKNEIQQKKLEFQYKSTKQYVQDIQKQRNFIPTKQAEQVLNQNIKLLKKIISNEKTNKNNEKYLIDQSFQGNCNKENNYKSFYQKSGINLTDPKKQFMIRKQHKSFYNDNLTNQNSYSQQCTLNKTLSNFPKGYQQPLSRIVETINLESQKKEKSLLKKRQQQVQHHKIWMDVQKQQTRRTLNWDDDNFGISNQKQKQILLVLYEFYKKNDVLIKEVQNETNSYRILSNSPMNLTIGAKNISQMINTKQKYGHKSMNQQDLNTKKSQSESQLNLLQTQNSRLKNFSNFSNNFVQIHQINLKHFPLLDSILHPRLSQSALESQECSIISDQIISQNQRKANQNNLPELKKRVTLQNMFIKK